MLRVQLLNMLYLFLVKQMVIAAGVLNGEMVVQMEMLLLQLVKLDL